MRFLLANLAIFAFYVGNGMLGTYLDIRAGQPHDSILFAVYAALQWTALPVAIVVNCRMLRFQDSWRGWVYGTLLGAVIFGLAFPVYGLIVLWFHLALGGTL